MRFLRLLKRELGAEARDWIDEGLVTREQAERILQRYGATLPTGRERSLGYYVLISLAALFGGLSLLVLVSNNWEDIPREVRMGGLLLLTLAFHAVGYRTFRRGAEAFASVWFFLGCLSYGTAIFLIAQIYHLGEHYPDGILWWALGTLPFAIVTRTLPCAYLATALSAAWLVAETSESFVPTAWPLMGAPLFWFCLYVRHSKLIFLSLVVSGTIWLEVLVSRWLSASLDFESAPELVPLTLGLFVLYQAWGRAWEATAKNPEWVEYGAVLHLWAVRLWLITLLVFSFEDPWQELVGLDYTRPGLVWGFLFAVLCGTGLLSATQTRKRGGGVASQLAPWASCLFYAVLVTSSLVVQRESDVVVPLQVSTNLACIGVGIWLIVRAIEEALTHYFYAGIGLILMTALLRYLDLVGDYVGASALFLSFAVILYVAARYWGRRTGALS